MRNEQKADVARFRDAHRHIPSRRVTTYRHTPSGVWLGRSPERFYAFAWTLLLFDNRRAPLCAEFSMLNVNPAVYSTVHFVRACVLHGAV